MHRKIDVCERFRIPLERLNAYEEAGVLTRIAAGDFDAYNDDLRISVIAKAESLGFSFDEIVILIKASGCR